MGRAYPWDFNMGAKKNFQRLKTHFIICTVYIFTLITGKLSANFAVPPWVLHVQAAAHYILRGTRSASWPFWPYFHKTEWCLLGDRPHCVERALWFLLKIHPDKGLSYSSLTSPFNVRPTSKSKKSVVNTRQDRLRIGRLHIVHTIQHFMA